jgi:hypothetical protein
MTRTRRPEVAGLDPAVVEAIVDAISDVATLTHQVHALRAQLDLAADGATPDDLAAFEAAGQIHLLQWKGEELPRLRAWLTAPDARPAVH